MLLARLRIILSRVAGFSLRGRHDRDFEQEIEAHLAMLTDENQRLGLSPDEASRQARIRFGGVTQIRESRREQRGLPGIESILGDFRYAFRTLRSNPGFATLATLTLALGIGVNTTLFTAFDAIALKPLPVKDSSRVVRLRRWFASGAQGNGQYLFSYPEYRFYRDQNRAFSSLVAASDPFGAVAESQPGAPETVLGQLVSGNYFRDLGAEATLGRTFLPEETTGDGAHPVIVLSDPYWRRRWDGDARIPGKTINLNGTIFTIIGVAAQDFIGTGNPPRIPDFWAPMTMAGALAAPRGDSEATAEPLVQMIGRLSPGTGLEQAQANAAVLAGQYVAAHPDRDKTIAVTVERATFFGLTSDARFRAFVAALMLVVGMVLLIACANLANMLLARATERNREIAVRLALGAGRGRVIRQLLCESLLLALAGGVAGLVFAMWASRLLWLGMQEAVQSFLWIDSALVVRIAPDFRIFSYTLLISVVTAIAFGLAPALQLSKPDVSSALKGEISAIGGRFKRKRLRSLLLIVQVGTSMILLITAGLLVRALSRSQSAETGYEATRLFWITGNYGHSAALYQNILERVKAVPAVRSVTTADRIPMTGTWSPTVRAGDGAPTRTLANYVAPSYFGTLGIPLLRGRTFNREESELALPVAVVSAAAARTLWPGQDPLGKRAWLDMNFRGNWKEFEVIGVAQDVRTANLSRVDPSYFYLALNPAQPNNILVRIEGDPRAASAAIRSTLDNLGSGRASLAAKSLEDFLVKKQRVMAKTGALFAVLIAGLALALAAVGIYGVMSYLVSQRAREIGVRMALGASPAQILVSVVADGLRPVFYGAAIGLAGAAAMSSLLKAFLVFPGSMDLLFGVSALDPVTFVGLTMFLALIATVAGAVPARRATLVDPVVTLRYE